MGDLKCHLQLCTQNAEAIAVKTVMTNWISVDHLDLFIIQWFLKFNSLNSYNSEITDFFQSFNFSISQFKMGRMSEYPFMADHNS